MRELNLPPGMSLLDLTAEQRKQLPPPREPSEEEWDVARQMVADKLECEVGECERGGCTWDFLYIRVGRTLYPATKGMTWNAYQKRCDLMRVTGGV